MMLNKTNKASSKGVVFESVLPTSRVVPAAPFCPPDRPMFYLFIKTATDSYDHHTDVYIFFKFSGKKLVNRKEIAFLVPHQYLWRGPLSFSLAYVES